MVTRPDAFKELSIARMVSSYRTGPVTGLENALQVIEHQ
jgi:hypothetical protein